MFNRLRNAILSTPGFRLGMLLSALAVLGSTGVHVAHAADAADTKAPLQLAERIAYATKGDDRSTDLALMASYEAVYGAIGNLPARWPALVRRTLVCQQLADHECIRTSIEALNKQPGGIDALQLTHLFEVSRFGMSVDVIKMRLHEGDTGGTTAAASGKHAASVASGSTQNATQSVPAERKPIPYAEIGPANPANPASSPAADPAPAASAEPSEPAKAAPAAHPAGKTPRSLTQRAAAKLSKLGLDDQAGYFLDALFIAVVVCLVLLFMLYSSGRARRAERVQRLQALQEIQRLEELHDEEKIKTDHDMWSEKLKSEVTLEAQKLHADEVLKTVRAAADEALRAEMQRFKTEKEAADEAFQAENRRLTDALKNEQAKTDDMVKAAKARADQAIDAYDQMAARELVYAHKQNDELQEELKTEKQAREALDARIGDALQRVETYKQRELRLQEAIHVEQRGRASETRLATEKLKAAQQAAAALQAALAALRVQHAELQRRLEEVQRVAQAGGNSSAEGATSETAPGQQRNA